MASIRLYDSICTEKQAIKLYVAHENEQQHDIHKSKNQESFGIIFTKSITDKKEAKNTIRD